MDKEYVNLIDIIRYVYYKKNNKKYNEKENLNFKTDTTKKLKKITKGLGIKIENYKSENDYKIPKLVAEIFKLYLLEKSSKKSFISKISNNDIDSISKEEKIAFLNKIVDKLKEKVITDEEKDECEEIRGKFLEDIEYNDLITKKINDIKINSYKLLDESCKRFARTEEKDGLIRVDDNIYQEAMEYNKVYSKENLYDEEVIKTISIDIFEIEDRLEFLEYLNELVREMIKKWNSIIHIANEIKTVSIDDRIEYNGNDYFINEDRMIISGKILLEESIKEYNHICERKYKVEEKSKKYNYDIKKILDEIKNKK